MTAGERTALRVDTTSPVPPYERIRAQLAALITSGRLAEGERLPRVRPPAADLGLAAGTVARAYREPETASLIPRGGGGGGGGGGAARPPPPPPRPDRPKESPCPATCPSCASTSP
ncbi:GntR family transcriptional regulator, partial [Streptomyces sp. NPDC052301]|uniref:GntR family transcriptional regulator n=1 Tax=Streptomyces sp. NPDC052301 TaxID=3365687 RepID=UPI0037D705FB